MSLASRWWPLVLIGSLTWTAPASHAADASDGELLLNPGFNEEARKSGLPDAWSVSPTAAGWREKTYLSRDYEIFSRPGAYVLATQRLALKPGQRYTLVITLKGQDGALGGALLTHGLEKPTREMPILWNVEPTADYERYVASFVAPNPVAMLHLYNVSRKGTIAYDHVSLREGPPDRPYIGMLTLKPIDRPTGAPVGTRHIRWASPLAGGPIKALFTIRTFLCSGDMAGLAQRLQLDYDLVHTGYLGDESISETGRQATRRLEASYYQVYVVPSRVSEVLAKTIRQRVEQGAGLVVIEGFGQASKFAPRADWHEVDSAHALRAGIPWELMPEKILSSVQTAQIGQGRAVRLVFPMDKSRVWGLLPSENSMDAYKSRQLEYWEWWHSLLAKAVVWAARREGNSRLRLAQATPASLTLAADAPPQGARLRVVLRSAREIRFDGPLLRMPPREVPLAADGTASIAIPPDLPAGTVVADAVLLDAQGASVAWGSFTTAIPQRVRIAQLSADRDTYGAGDTVSLALMLTCDAPTQATLQARLVDAFGRVVAEARRAERIGPAPRAVTLGIDVSRPLTVLHRGVVRVLVEGREQDSQWVDVLVPEVGPATAAADFVATAWSPGMTHPVLLAEFAARMRGLGFNSQFASSLYATSEHGLPVGGYIEPPAGVFRLEKPSAGGIRPQCLSNPAVVEKYTASAREAAQRQRPYGMFAAGITDEAFLTSRHQRDEVCFCTHCQERYRRWLQQRYGSLEALNAEWGTKHASWSEVRGARTEDVRGKENFAPFVDFRTFMTDVWIDACRTVTDAYHQEAPHVPVGHTNTFGAEPFNGNDYWKLSTQAGFGWGQEYSEAIKSQGQKAIFEIWRSFVETPEARRTRSANGRAESAAPFFNYGWIGYDHSVAAAHYEPWWLALHGARGLSWYAVNSMDVPRGISWSLAYPDLRITPYAEAAAEGLRDLRGGCGKLLMEYTREEPQIALLWSYSSMLVAWCESRCEDPEPNERPGSDSFVTHYLSALGFRQHADELQLDCNYLAPDQILAGDALSRYRLVFLPFSVAVSPAVVEKLRAYVEHGGMLLGDLRCLRTDEHGKPFAGAGPLEQLFGVKRRGLDAAYGRSKVKFTAAAAGLDLRGRETELFGREPLAATTAQAIATHASGEPAVLVQSRGKGMAVYLNFCLPEFDPVTRDLVAQLARRAGVQACAVAQAVAGDAPPRCYERDTFGRGPIRVHAFIRDHRRCKDQDPVRFDFRQPTHVYDIRAGRHLGHTAQVQTVLAPGETAFYACLPYRVTALTATIASPASPGSPLPVRISVRGDGAIVGDHVIHVDLVAPDGRPVEHYAQNVLAQAGTADLQIPLAMSDPTGRWTLRVRDVLTGTTAQTRCEVRGK
jgi:beta-galactosidase